MNYLLIEVNFHKSIVPVYKWTKKDQRDLHIGSKMPYQVQRGRRGSFVYNLKVYRQKMAKRVVRLVSAFRLGLEFSKTVFSSEITRPEAFK